MQPSMDFAADTYVGEADHEVESSVISGITLVPDHVPLGTGFENVVDGRGSGVDEFVQQQSCV